MSDNSQSLEPTEAELSRRRGSLWKQSYRDVRHEKDVKRLTDAVIATETAIYTRMQELSALPNHSEERAEIQAANEELLQVKTRTLGWPDLSK